MENLTLETLPKAFSQLTHEVGEIKRLLLEKSSQAQHQTDRWFDLTELCEYLPEKPVKATVYGWVHSSVIPYHKRGKKLYFLKSKIDNWLKEGRRKTLAEAAAQAENYLLNKKKRG